MRKLPVANGRQMLHAVATLLKKYKTQIAAVMAMQIVASSAAASLPLFTGKVIDQVQAGTTLSTVMSIISIGVAAVLVGSIFNYGAQYLSRTLGETIFADLREGMMHTTLHLSLSVVEEAGSGDLLGRTTRDLSQLEYVVRRGVSDVLALVTSITVTVVFAVSTSPILSLALVVPLPLMVTAIRWYMPRTIPAYAANATAWAALSGVISETVEQIETVDAARLADLRIARFDEAIRRVWRLERYTAWMRLGLWSSMIVLALLPVALSLLAGAWFEPLGLVTLGQVTTVALYCYQIREPIWGFVFWLDQIQSSGAAFARVTGVGLAPRDRQSRGLLPEGNQVKIEQVRYSYHEGSEVLHGINLDLVPGETLSMVGPSGAGKSTLGRMIAGIHPPSAGNVTIGGAELTELDESLLHQKVILVTQEQHVFAGTLADNLRLAAPDATKDQLQAALDAVAWDSALGLESKVGSGGEELSPGEAQQLALARLVLVNPEVVVLDEATSMMDSGSAKPLERSLGKILSGRTVVAVTHRLHTTPQSDRVAVMVEGELVELGSHKELLAAGGDYADLWHSWQR